jgi:MFS family permease
MKPSLRKYFVYALPWSMDFANACFTFLCVLEAGRIGASPVAIGLLGTFCGTLYFLTCTFFAKRAHRKNAELCMILSAIVFILLSATLLFFHTLLALFLLLGLCGAFTALFFIGFQLWMGDSAYLPPLKAAGIYTFAWSSGLAFGMLAQGFLAERGMIASLLPVVGASLLTLIVLRWLSRLNRRDAAQGIVPDLDSGFAVSAIRRIAFVRIGWISIFVVTFLSMGLRFLLPGLVINHLHLPAYVAGLAVFSLLFTQGVTGLVLMERADSWYTLRLHGSTKIFAAIACVIAFFLHGVIGVLLFTFCLGIYSGHAYYAAVLYAIEDEEHAGMNVGVNEALVGAGTIIGPLAFGLARQGGTIAFFFLPVFFLFAAFFIQIRLFFLLRRRELSISVNRGE